MPEAFRFLADEMVLEILDQRLIPFEVRYVRCRNASEVANAIVSMVVRGAPAIGIAAAFGVALDAIAGADVEKAISLLKTTRPTAINLFWALDRMKSLVALPSGERPGAMLKEALSILEEDIQINKAIGFNGAALLPNDAVVITHCNTGSLATGGYGTALGVIRAAVELGKKLEVFVDETRPRFQGAKLTAFELFHQGIAFTVMCDSMAHWLMKKRRIDAVIVGADRIAMNGDVANKIGTYSLAVGARHHGVPFYVAAPISTVDPNSPSGDGMPIEERSHEEVSTIGDQEIFPKEYPIWNPSFDVTPHDLISAIITEKGVLHPPYEKALRGVLAI